MKAPETLQADSHCRNCGAVTSGNYCAHCGQETRTALPTARQFMREATGRLISWDSRLWRTLYALAFRPGFLTKVYLAGRRRFYVRPARLFLAMSLILFAVIRFEIGSDTGGLLIVDKPNGAAAKQAGTSADKDDDRDDVRSELRKELPDGTKTYTGLDWLSLNIDENMNLDVRGTDSKVLRELRDRFNKFNRLSTPEKSERLVDGALRYGSYLLFLLLPVFAVLQYLAYAGRGRRYPGRPRLYAEHLVYGAHLHTFAFLILILLILVPWPPARWALLAWTFFYVTRARRNVYGGSRWGGAARAVMVGVVYLIAQAIGLAGLLLASILLR
jgi:hypothetical protein